MNAWESPFTSDAVVRDLAAKLGLKTTGDSIAVIKRISNVGKAAFETIPSPSTWLVSMMQEFETRIGLKNSTIDDVAKELANPSFATLEELPLFELPLFTLDELKEIARQVGVTFRGNIKPETLINRIKTSPPDEINNDLLRLFDTEIGFANPISKIVENLDKYPTPSEILKQALKPSASDILRKALSGK